MGGNIYPSYGLSGTTKSRGISGSTKSGKNALDVNILGQVGENGGIITLQKNITTSGTPLKLSPHIVATTIAFNEVGATGDTITDSGNGFLNAGFAVGDYIYVSGSTSNDGTYQIKTVVAGTITVADTDDLVSEIAGDTVTIVKVASATATTEYGTPISLGVKVTVKAKSSNSGTITVGYSSATALNTNTSHLKLESNESIELFVSNLNKIWLDATSSGDGVEVIYEA